MSETVGPIFTAVLAANFFTILLVWGLYQGTKVYEAKELSFPAALAILVPAGLLIAGAWAYW